MSLPSIDDFLVPISEASPCGEDSKYEFCYEVMEVEVKKFGSLFGETVDWNIVKTNAADVIINYSKDLKATCYLIRAWIEEAPVLGIANGLALLDKTLEEFHSGLYPKRKRGRDGALEWLVSQLESVISKLELTSDDFETINNAAKLSQDIHFKISEYYEDSEVSFFSVRDGLVTASNRIEPCESAPVDNAPTVNEAVSVVETPAPKEAPKVEPAVAKPAVPVETVPAPEPKATVVKKVAAKPDFETDFSSSSEARKTLERTAEYLLSLDASSPLAYRIYRFVTWQELDELPPVISGKKTPLRLPISADQCAEYREGSKSEDCASLIKKLERSLVNSPFWLTGHKLQFDMLEHLGYSDAAKAVQQEAQSVVNKWPGLDELCFSDDLPFADEATLAWLQEQSVVKASPQVDMLEEFSLDTVTPDNIGEVIFKISQLFNNDGSGRSSFINHLQLTEVYQRAGLYQLCLPHLEMNWPTRIEMNLAHWEPQLCRQFDDLALSILRHLYDKDEMVPEKYQVWLQTINKQ